MNNYRMPVDNALQAFWFSKSNNYNRIPSRINSCKSLNRVVYTYRDVLLEHIGSVSTFAERNNPGFRRPFPKCKMHINSAWNLNVNELFSAGCGNLMLSPCSGLTKK